MTQFEIWWAELREPAGRRPVLLLSRPDAYTYLNKFIVAEITSTIRGIASEVVIGETEGLPKVCAINCDNLRRGSAGAADAAERGACLLLVGSK